MKILITGASSGLGAEMGRQFAALGHDLVVTARRVDRLHALRAEITSRHPDCRVDVAALDVQDPDAVFAVVREHRTLDRVVVNAGLGSAVPVGTGGHEHNRQVALTNFVAAVTQVEAAMEAFRAQGYGHLVVISSFAAVRGLGGSAAVYAATKRGIAHLAEGVRAETLGTGIAVTVVYPGFIRSEMTANRPNAPFTVDTEPGVRAMVRGIEAERASVYAPTLPWAPLSLAFRALPLSVVAKLAQPER